MSKLGLVTAGVLAVVLVAGCERSSAVASKGHGDNSDRASSYDDRGSSGSYDRSGSSDRSQARRDDVPVKLVDGKPMWSSSRKGSAEENAQRSFDRNGEAFGARDLDDFVKKAHAFVDHPPSGTETLKRRNGDMLFYNAKDNVFAVANKDGAPRAMFKPDQGAAYWTEQKTREAKRETARSDRRANADSDG